MKIRLIIQHHTWEHQLRVRQQLPGRYYVELCDANGGSYKPSIFTGTYPSLDLIVEHAHGIHLQLVAMHERAAEDRAAAAILEQAHAAPSL